MNGGESSSSDINMKDVSKGYDDSTSDDEEFEVIVPPNPPPVSCKICRRMFQFQAEFLNHVEACLAREKMIQEQKDKGQDSQVNSPARGAAEGPSAAPLVAPSPPAAPRPRAAPRPSAAPRLVLAPRVLNLFNDPLELRLAPPGPPPPPRVLSLELTLGGGRTRSRAIRQQLLLRNNGRCGPRGGNVGRNFRR